MASKHDMTMPPRDGRRSAPKVKSPDQQYEERRRIDVFQIWGPQEPGPHDPPKVKTKRGRV